MNEVKQLRDNEPAALGSAILGLVSTGMVLLAAFGVNITEEQHQAIIAAVGAVITLATTLGVGYWIRSKVTPVK